VIELEYRLRVTPREAVLGEPVIMTLSCAAAVDAPGAITFDHSSLILALRNERWPDERLRMPNVTASENGGMLVRVQLPGGIEDLAAGEQRTREFLLFDVFPDALDLGVFEVAYRFDESTASPPQPARVRLYSGPPAVPALVQQLLSAQAPTRHRAAGLLHRLTGQEFGYDPDGDADERADAAQRWQQWWDLHGQTMTWDSRAHQVSVARVTPRTMTADTGRLGGVVYHAVAPRESVRSAVVERLMAWQQHGTLPSLAATERVADQVVEYPPDPDVPDWDDGVERELAEAIDRLATRARNGEDQVEAGLVILATIPPRASAILHAAIARLADTISGDPRWRRLAIRAAALLDAVEPDRVPVGG
jgi:hypothetical protein